jgi:predicted CoA-substrate-specific enzyme activase
MTWTLGLDMGSSFVKGVLLTDGGGPYYYMEKSGCNYRETAVKAREQLLKQAHVSEDECRGVMVTGCGEPCVSFGTDRAVEMICLIRAVSEIYKDRCVLLDMGGQSSRLGIMNKEGRLESFDFNEKCASGSGKVLENVAYVLHVSFDRLSQLSADSNKVVSFTTSCAVFAESETITAVAKGERIENIIAGFHQSIAIKLAAMIGKNKTDGAPIFAVGGMAIDSALIVALENMIDKKITVLENLQHCVAMGAALLARDKQSRQ